MFTVHNQASVCFLSPGAERLSWRNVCHFPMKVLSRPPCPEPSNVRSAEEGGSRSFHPTLPGTVGETEAQGWDVTHPGSLIEQTGLALLTRGGFSFNSTFAKWMDSRPGACGARIPSLAHMRGWRRSGQEVWTCVEGVILNPWSKCLTLDPLGLWRGTVTEGPPVLTEPVHRLEPGVREA